MRTAEERKNSGQIANIGICFTLKDGISIPELREKLSKIRDTLEDEYAKNVGKRPDEDCFVDAQYFSCHLIAEQCKERGFSTEVPDLLREVFGLDYYSELEGVSYNDLSNIDKARENLAKKVDKVFVVLPKGSDITNGIYKEITTYSDNKIIFV
jgi:adenylyl- and sulfurtransferase ThiI